MKYSLVLILLVALQSCNSEKCNSVSNFDVGELLLISSKEKSYNYCELLENAIKKDQEAIIKISLLQFDGSAGYDHGYVLVKLIDTIGENEYLKAIQNIYNKEKGFIEGYLDVGLEYGNIKKFQEQSLEKAFPKIYTFLTTK